MDQIALTKDTNKARGRLQDCPVANKSISKLHGSLVVSALAFSARCHGFDPRGRRGKISVSEHAFLSVICNDDTK